MKNYIPTYEDFVNEDILNDPNAKLWDTRYRINYDDLPANIDLRTPYLDKLFKGIPYQHYAFPQVSDDGNLIFKNQRDLDKAKKILFGIHESTVNEGSKDFVAKYSNANINLKNGYKKHSEDELTALYNKIGELIKGESNIKDVTVIFESYINEGDMTKFYDGFLVLDAKTKEMYKFKYIKGISNSKVEVDAINKLVNAKHRDRSNFMVHGFVKKGEWNMDKTPVLESSVYEAKAKDLKPNHKYTSDYGEVTFIKLNPDGKTMKLHSKEIGEIKTDISNAYNMELIESVVNEGIGTIALGIMLAWGGIKVLKAVTKKVLGNIASNIEIAPDKLKQLTTEMAMKVEQDTGNGRGLLLGSFLKLDLDKKIGSGEIKTVNDLNKAMKAYLTTNESTVNEAKDFKSTKDFLDFLEEIDGMPENRIKRIMGNKYIDTPGGYRDEADDYDNDIEEYMIANMGRKEFDKLKTYWETNVKESTTFVTESSMGDVHIMAEEAKTFDEFKAEFIKEYSIGKKDNNKELHNWLQGIWKENHKK